MRVDLQIGVALQWIYSNSYNKTGDAEFGFWTPNTCNVCSYSDSVLILIPLHFMSFPENDTFGNIGEAILF